MNTPWTIVEMAIPRHDLGYRAIVDADGDTICSPSPMGDANARLIAAAPDLLAALKLAVDSLHKAFDYVPAGHENAGCRGNLVPTLQNARAAIAKATGA